MQRAEAIRNGLPNGSGAWLHSWDLAVGTGTTLNDITVQWTAVDTAFTDQYPTYAGWTAPTTSAPYRCVWTHELR